MKEDRERMREKKRKVERELMDGGKGEVEERREIERGERIRWTEERRGREKEEDRKEKRKVERGKERRENWLDGGRREVEERREIEERR